MYRWRFLSFPCLCEHVEVHLTWEREFVHRSTTEVSRCGEMDLFDDDDTPQATISRSNGLKGFKTDNTYALEFDRRKRLEELSKCELALFTSLRRLSV